jgi:chromosome segregation ATPase
LEKILARVPQAASSAERELTNSENKLTKANSLQSVWLDIKRIQNIDLPTLEQERNQYIDEKNVVLATLEETESEIAALEVEYLELKELKQSVADFLRLDSELQVLTLEVNSITNDLMDSGSTQTMEDVQMEYEKIQGEMKIIRARIDRINNETRIKQQTLQAKQNRLRELKMKAMEVDFKVKERDRFLLEIRGYQMEIDKLKENLIVF